MPLPAWLLWTILAIILLVVEMLTPEFIVASFSLGSFAAALTAALNGSLHIQLLVFVIVTAIFLWKVRPVFLRFFSGDSPETRTNVYGLKGQQARVIKSIGPGEKPGRVLIGGEDWLAVSVAGEKFIEESIVEVVEVQGAKVLVKKSTK